MLQFPPWKVALIVGVCALGLILALPNLLPRATVEALPDALPLEQVNLGLDLRGGAHLLFEVELAAVVAERLESLEGEVRPALRRERIGYDQLGVQDGAVVVSLTDVGQADAATEALAELNTTVGGPLSLTPAQEFTVDRDGRRLELRLTEEAVNQRRESIMAQSIEIVRRRIDEAGTREPTIQRQGADRILVQVPGIDNPEAIKELIGQTAVLNFHLVDLNTSVAEAERGALPPGSVLLPSQDIGPDGQPVPYVVRKRVEVSGENLIDAQPSFQDNQPVVSFRFDTVGARKFGQVTTDHVNELLAVVLDDTVISAPRIQEPILGGSGVITGNFTVPEANQLAILLRAGALPAELTVIEERTVGPDLGADSIRAGAIASVLAILLVMGFMVWTYGPLFGGAACVALFTNLVLIVGVLSALQATLTLPGIAGIVLTVGMAVDANVLIFERVREEVRLGKPPLSALEGGYRLAMRTIIDANLTTLIAVVLLYALGSGPVRGFAVTLGIGIVTSMFTAILLTRLLVATWLRRTRPAALPV